MIQATLRFIKKSKRITPNVYMVHKKDYIDGATTNLHHGEKNKYNCL